MSLSQTIHATTVSLNGLGVLLRGEPGSGKSSLALQLMEQPGTGLADTVLAARIVADDQTVLTLQNGKLQATAPDALKGLLELRGLGLLPVTAQQDVAIVLVVDLKPAATIERLPDKAALYTDLMGVTLPRIDIDASHPSAAALLRTAFVAITKGSFPP
jgi:HPr kinase/phosphorylase